MTLDDLAAESRACIDQARNCRNPRPCDHCESLARRLTGAAREYAATQVELHARGPYRNRAKRIAEAQARRRGEVAS